MDPEVTDNLWDKTTIINPKDLINKETNNLEENNKIETKTKTEEITIAITTITNNNNKEEDNNKTLPNKYTNLKLYNPSLYPNNNNKKPKTKSPSNLLKKNGVISLN